MLHSTRLEKLARANNLAYWAISKLRRWSVVNVTQKPIYLMSMEILQHNSVKQCLYAFLAVLSNFRTDVTFEIRTAVQSNVFIQLITTHKIQLSFISEMEKGERGKIAERQKESKGERASIGWQQI